MMKYFFEGYKKIRDNKINANNLFEIPALFSMLPDLKNKRILDLEHLYKSAMQILICREQKISVLQLINIGSDSKETLR